MFWPLLIPAADPPNARVQPPREEGQSAIIEGEGDG
jgi:hypothetical protein